MMEFWPENQAQSHLYSRYGTVPGRNCTHNYHDRHQPTHYSLYYGEQQDQSRESTYWTAPGSRTAGAIHEYTNWTDPELASPSSSHFPFILGHHTQHHQDLGEYQLQEAREREWKAAHRAVRDHERGFLREGWQRRWDPCSPVRYNKEVSAKRNDSSYRELEAWAARYSHSLPRRRRIEAELKGASQGLLQTSRIGTALQHVRPPANIRESGLWDRGGRQQAPAYYPSQAPAPDTSNMLDMKEKTSNQRKLFSQPPGYIAPPPYNSPHKISPVTHRSDTGWEQDTKKQNYCLQPTLRKQDVSVYLQDTRTGEKEELTNSGENKSCPKHEGLKRQRSEADALQAVCPISVQQTHTQRHSVLPLQHPQMIQNSETNKETSSKVIEGRKFRLSKKTGGMTIFCLVSRIAGPTETPSLPICSFKTNIQHTDMGEASKPLGAIGEIDQKLADEVDFRWPTITEQSDNDDKRKRETPEKKMLEDNLANKAEADVVPSQKENANDVCRQAAQSVQPVSVKYPLWREPSFTSRAENESPSTRCVKGNSEEEQSDDCVHVSSPPVDTEEKELDIQEDTKDSEGLLVIDTTCIVVKMEQIPLPTKEHVHYLGPLEPAEESPPDPQTVISPELNCQLNQNVTTNQSTEASHSHKYESPKTDLDSSLLEKHKQESEIALSYLLSSCVSERETLEERAERILGIPLHDCITEPKDVTSFIEPSVHEPDEEGETSSIEADIHHASKQTPENTAGNEPSQNHLEDLQTKDGVCLKDHDDSRDQVTSEDGDDFVGSQDQVSDRYEENDTNIPPEKGNKTLSETEKTEDPLLESTGEKVTGEHDQEDDHENYSQPPDLCHSLSPLPSDFPSPSNISEEDPEPELATLALHPESTSHSSVHQQPSFLYPQSPESSPASTPHADDSPSPPPPPDLTDQTIQAVSGAEEEDEEDEEAETLHVTQSELSNMPLAMDMKEEVVSQQQHECDQLDDAACVDDEQQTNGANEESTRPLEQNNVNILQQELESVQTEAVLCLNESTVTREQPEPVDSSELHEENEDNPGQTQAKIFQQLDCGKEEDAFCIKESHMIEDKEQKTPDELPVHLWEQTMCKNSASDFQNQLEIEILQDTEPQIDSFNSSPLSAADCEVSQSPLDELSVPQLPSPPQPPFQCECVSVLDTDSVCPSPLHPDIAAGIQETVPPSPSLDGSLSSFTESPAVPPPSSTPLYEEENLTLSPDFLQFDALKQAQHYPQSLRDVVNRIRKHTAPDSENEEEEVTELWDPENFGEKVALDTTEKIIFDEDEQHKVSKECAEVEEIQRDHKEPRGHDEEDTLSCSSTTSSHGSGDTVIGADENEAEETARDAETEHKTEESEMFKTAEAEICYSSEVEHEAPGEEGEEEEDEADTNEPCLSLECSVEIMETEVECGVAVVADNMKG